MAILLSLLLPGLGQFYAGSAAKGVMFLMFSVVNFVLMFAIIGFFFQTINWLWSMIDANMTANDYNTRLIMSAA